MEKEVETGKHIPPKQPSAKQIWLLTYGSTGPRITIGMLRDEGNLTADECHSTADQAIIYTYVHLTKAVRRTSIEKFMKNVEDCGIIKQEIFGYDAVHSSKSKDDPMSIFQHVAFKMLVKHGREKHHSFIPCTNGEAVLTRGHLFRAVDNGKSECKMKSTKQQLLERIKKLEKCNERQASDGTRLVDAEIDRFVELLTENRIIKAENHRLLLENSNLVLENTSLKRKIDAV